jgi:hypothetical protein
MAARRELWWATCRPDTDRWLRRTFVIRDGFLLYYDEAKVATSWFDTRPKVRAYFARNPCQRNSCAEFV